MIERYGDQIEADLFERGWDFLDYFRGTRPWPQLVRLVDTLPAWSHTGRAMIDDDELQKYREKHGLDEKQKGRNIRWGQWTQFDELTAVIGDAADAIRKTIAQANAPKGKTYRFTPHKRPRTAADRAEERRDRETVAEIVALALPRSN